MKLNGRQIRTTSRQLANTPGRGFGNLRNLQRVIVKVAFKFDKAYERILQGGLNDDERMKEAGWHSPMSRESSSAGSEAIAGWLCNETDT